MRMATITKKPIARIDNQFVYNARYQLSAREQKVILFLISKIDPIRQESLLEQVISVKDLEIILKGGDKHWGGIYKELKSLAKRLVKKGIEFSTDIEIGGQKFSGYINWFQGIEPVKDEEGNISLSFLFSQKLQPFLLDLKEYVAVNLLEVVSLKSAFSIRMYQVFRAHRDRMGKYQKRSKLTYDLPELKALLGVADKYKDYRNFRLKVLEILKKEVTKHTSISVNFKPLKKGRSVVGIEFEFWDKGTREIKSNKSGGIDFNTLRYAQIKAFDRLVAYGVNDGIALEMLSKIGGSEIQGFEDWYISVVTDIFESKTNQQECGAKAGTLVIWFLKKKVFEQGDHFATIMERLQARKKKLQVEQPDVWGNRMIAKDITAIEFEELVKKQREQQRNKKA